MPSLTPDITLPFPLVLASASPRRRQLLADAGYCFEIIPPIIAEPQVPAFGKQHPVAWAEALAYFKACAVLKACPEKIILAADTIVAFQNHIIGKPADRDDARRILSTMFAGESRVITGVAVLVPQRARIITHAVSTLTMRAMTSKEMEDYLDSGAWRDKAGAYALQEGGDAFLQKLEGSWSNVVGLPMERLYEIFSALDSP